VEYYYFLKILLCQVLLSGLRNINLLFQRFNAFKYHWSENRVPVILEVNQGSLDQVDPATRRKLCSYDYKDMEGLTQVGYTN